MGHECGECGREFETRRGLKVHQGQKHGEESSKESSTETDRWNIEIPKPSFSGKSTFLTVLLIGLAAGFTAGYMSPELSSLLPEQDAEVDVSMIDNDGDPVLGDSDANVTMVIYEDFQCPFCQRFEENTVKQVESQYVDSGKLKIVWKDFPLERIHPQAVRSAEVMECIYREDNSSFWKVKDRIFSQHGELYPRGPGGYETTAEEVEEKLVNWSSEVGVNESGVRECLENGNPRSEVAGDVEEGRSFGTTISTPQGDRDFVSGTPATVIYAEGDSMGEPIIGAQPFSAVQKVIEGKLQG